MYRSLPPILFLFGIGLAGAPSHASACGCLSPPVPPPPGAVDEQAYAVNQQSEQIIFEVPGDGTVTAHVLIRYAGEPESFAWIVPVPSLPEFALSESSAFAILEPGTAPAPPPPSRNVCPSSAYSCRNHPTPFCRSSGGGGGGGCGIGCSSGAGSASDAGFFFADGSADRDAGGSDMPPVDVIDRRVIGSYETITFAASDTAAAVTWLQDEGFIVNDTMAPFMQPYADAGMLFVASRLVPGAGIDQIRPLRMTYLADRPMIPLRLTAVAAEPHLTVTTYIYGYDYFAAVDHPEIEVADEDVVIVDGRSNYPMAMARLIDEAGGDAFVAEYRGAPYVPIFGDGTPCCDSDFDRCLIGGDGLCQCPLSDFDMADCEELSIRAGAELLMDLASRYTHLTRITTRLSPEEMSFDPMFEPRPDLPAMVPTQGYGGISVEGCVDDVLGDDRGTVELARDLSACATTYCAGGECVLTELGAGCACNPGFVARRFLDVDNRPSVTCIPDVPMVDLSAGGLELPDACDGIDCGNGTCLDVGGFPTCDCDGGDAASVTGGAVPSCRPILRTSGDRGGHDYTSPLDDIRICAPPPPASCGANGWLEERLSLPGNTVLCDTSMPDPRRLVIPPMPTCPDVDEGGCSVGQRGAPTIWLPLLGVLAAFVFRRLTRRR